MGVLSLNAMDKIIRQAGGIRVSLPAKKVLADVLEEQAIEIGKEAKKFAEHAGRRTITDKDVRLAVKSL